MLHIMMLNVFQPFVLRGDWILLMVMKDDLMCDCFQELLKMMCICEDCIAGPNYDAMRVVMVKQGSHSRVASCVLNFNLH